MSNTTYIVIYNQFFVEGKHKLSSEELYLYCLLSTLKSPFLQATTITLKLLSDNKALSLSTCQRSINKCKSLILSLEQKQVISIEANEDFAANAKITIRFPFIEQGYERFEPELWNKADNPDELIVLYYLKRFHGFKKAKDSWSEMLGYGSKNPGIKIVNQMELDGKIHHVEGDKYTDQQGRLKQHSTKWYLGSKKVEDIKLPVQKQPEQPDVDYGNWKNGNNLTESDYDLYVANIDNVEFMKIVEIRINRITKNKSNDKALFAVNKSIKEAEDRASKRAFQVKQEEALERKNNTIFLIESNENTLIEREGEYIPLDLNNIRFTDKLSYIKQHPGPYAGTYIDVIESMSFKRFLIGGSEYSNTYVYPETLEELKSVAIKLLSVAKFSQSTFVVMVEQQEEIFAKNNADRPHDVAHDGDELIGDSSGEYNAALMERRRKYSAANR